MKSRSFEKNGLLVVTMTLVAFIGLSGYPRALASDATQPGDHLAQTRIGKPGSVAELHSLGQLKTLFERDRGRVRLVLLVSPT